MKPIYPIIVFFALLMSSALASIHSYKVTENDIVADLNIALSKTLEQKKEGWITPDTIQNYRSNISIPELRGCAFISYCLPDEHRPRVSSNRMIWRKNGRSLSFRGYADCSMATVFCLSNQSLPMTLFSMSLLWAMLSLFYDRKHKSVLLKSVTSCNSFGGITYYAEKDSFCDINNMEIHLTPMQCQLMKKFLDSGTHRLSKEEICDELWPKKEDASETLYTLIRRIRPILEKHSNLKIESDRGRAYFLTDSLS